MEVEEELAGANDDVLAALLHLSAQQRVGLVELPQALVRVRVRGQGLG